MFNIYVFASSWIEFEFGGASEMSWNDAETTGRLTIAAKIKDVYKSLLFIFLNIFYKYIFYC